MSFKTILTYIPSFKGAKGLLETGAQIADAHRAHLIGLHIVPVLPSYFPFYAAGQIPIPHDVLSQQQKALDKEAEKVKETFEKATANRAITPEWRCQTSDSHEFANTITDHARCTDLVIIGQETQDLNDANADLAARIAIETGRPTLVVPQDNRAAHVGKNVLIAWNRSREAARAAFDAIPLMRHADSVRILAINPDPNDRQRNFAQGDELALGLSRHGINTQVTTAHTHERSIGEELLNRVSDFNCDLLVMGSYGHSRMREMFFGGVTLEAVAKSPVPVLMSH